MDFNKFLFKHGEKIIGIVLFALICFAWHFILQDASKRDAAAVHYHDSVLVSLVIEKIDSVQIFPLMHQIDSLNNKVGELDARYRYSNAWNETFAEDFPWIKKRMLEKFEDDLPAR